MNLAAAVCLVVFIMNYVPDIASLHYENQVAAGKAWEYILTNAGVCVLLAILGVRVRKHLVAAACAWGFVESGERVVCRMTKPIADAPPVADLFSGLCGSPWYAIGLCAAAGLAVLIVRETSRETR